MTNIISAILISLLPILIILCLIYYKDKNKEPLKLLLLLFSFGIIAKLLTMYVYDYIYPNIQIPKAVNPEMNFLRVILYSFINIALLEELLKWIMTYIIGYKNKEFDETYDGVVYAVFVALGFAFYENIFYILNYETISTALTKTLIAIPGHTCNAIFMGYYLSLAKICSKKDKRLERKYIILSILAPTILHGIYDFCLMSNNILLISFFVIYASFLYIISIKKIKELSKYNKKIKNK